MNEIIVCLALPVIVLSVIVFLLSRIPLVGIFICGILMCFYVPTVNLLLKVHGFFGYNSGDYEIDRLVYSVIYLCILAFGMMLSLGRMWPWKKSGRNTHE